GSFSGIDFSPDGVLYAVSDKARWFAARPVIKGGRLLGLDGAGLAPILNHAGEPLVGKRWGDAEGLRIVARDGVPVALVSFEAANDLRAFSGRNFALSHSVDVPLPASAREVDGNAGFEGLAVAPATSPLEGGIVLIAERSLDGRGNHRGWIVGGPRDGAFSLVRRDQYDVTDATFLPDGDLLILERQLGFPLGVGMRIRRIAADDLRPGSTVDGDVLVEADLRYQIDNMEGIAVGRGPDGETLIALLSDNNQSQLQRTLLLYFALVEEPDATAEPVN
ncbi:MAG TPA: esterase-like activity of phytase family protein, partial [Bauldia sp.]|nr:esterase-like activity of phytase family protein [Bauldia sp.]